MLLLMAAHFDFISFSPKPFLVLGHYFFTARVFLVEIIIVKKYNLLTRIIYVLTFSHVCMYCRVNQVFRTDSITWIQCHG